MPQNCYHYICHCHYKTNCTTEYTSEKWQRQFIYISRKEVGRSFAVDYQHSVHAMIRKLGFYTKKSKERFITAARYHKVKKEKD